MQKNPSRPCLKGLLSYVPLEADCSVSAVHPEDATRLPQASDRERPTHSLPSKVSPAGVTPGRAGCSAHCGGTGARTAAGAHAQRAPQWAAAETRDLGHVTAEAPGAGPRADCGLPGGAAPTCPSGPGECGSPRGLTCLRPPPPSVHYVMPRHPPAQPTGARAAERKHTVHVARAAGPCEGGGRRAGSPSAGSQQPHARHTHRHATLRPEPPSRSYPRSVPWRLEGYGPHRAAQGCRRWGSRARLMSPGCRRLLRAARHKRGAAASCGSARQRARRLTGRAPRPCDPRTPPSSAAAAGGAVAPPAPPLQASRSNLQLRPLLLSSTLPLLLLAPPASSLQAPPSVRGPDLSFQSVDPPTPP